MEKRSLDNGSSNKTSSKKQRRILASPSSESDDNDPEENREEAPLVGIICRVSMSNFMCHNRLDVDLGTHVNFIIGRNGSGKSAIVTALVVGLGGKATATSRGSSVKNFVKAGKRSAWVEITLNNKGSDSYKPNVYGDKIVVKRKFSADGVSSYAIYSSTGQHVSNKRDELQRILDHLNIQVDNPVSILNQDTSRNFLNSRSAADKFKFFMKATQLEQMSSDYEQVDKNKEQTRLVISTKEEALVAMRREVKIWENKFKNLLALTDLKDKIISLKKELVWSMIAEKEKGMKPLEKILQAEEAALPRFVEKVEQSKKEQEKWQERHKGLEQHLIDCVKEVKELEPLLQHKKQEFYVAKEKIVPLTNQLKSIERELISTNRDRKQCQDRIQELKAIASRDYEAERLERVDKINKLKSHLDDLESKKKVLEHDADQFRNTVIKYKSELSNFESELAAIKLNRKNITLSKQRLLASKSDRLKRFGSYMPELIKTINNNRAQFHKLPKGPLGACFELVDPKWALAIECCLKGLASAFLCHDHHDEKLLEDIFQQINISRNSRPNIITCAFSNTVYDVRQYKVKGSTYSCILDVIKCDDPVIVNTLIDQKKIENIILIANSTEAKEVMLYKPPQNARECFTEMGEQLFHAPTFRMYATDQRAAKYLMANVQEQIMKLEEEEKSLEKEIQQISQKINKHQQEIQINQSKENKCKEHLTRISQNISQIKYEMNELQSYEDPDPVDVKTLEEEVETYEENIIDLRKRQDEIISEKKLADEHLNTVKTSYSQLEASIREKSDSGISLRKEEMSQAENELEKVGNAVKHYTGKLKEQQKQIKEAKEKVENYKAKLEEERQKASEFCDPVRTSRSPDNINNEIDHIKMRIQEQEKEQGNEPEITTTYKQKKDSLERVRKEVGQLQRYLTKLDEVMERRKAAYLKMRKLVANRAKFYFLLQMSQRQFIGKMNFDFEKETLEILVRTSQDLNDNVAKEVKDLKSLSGGERSFSTVCFILSLWEAMESPFRCLDEFDVFMDMVNRRISMDMMMATVDMHKNQQFIFLTPQDMSSVKKIHNVKIYRMQDPERNHHASNITSQLSEDVG